MDRELSWWELAELASRHDLPIKLPVRDKFDTSTSCPDAMTKPDVRGQSSQQDRIFRSVFKSPSFQPIDISNEDLTATNDAWLLVTEWLRLPQDPATTSRHPGAPPGFDDALLCLVSIDETNRRLIDWMSNQAQEYQDAFLNPILQPLWNSGIPCSQAVDIVSQTLDALISSHLKVLEGLDHWLASHREDHLTRAVTTLRTTILERVHASAIHTLPSKRFFKTVCYVLYDSICKWLLSPKAASTVAGAEARATESLLQRLRQGGYGGDSGQRALAHAMTRVIDSYVQSPAVKVDWIGRQSVTGKLRNWIQETFVPTARDCVRCLSGQPDTNFHDDETTGWEHMALEKLAYQRVKYLFEYVRAWDNSKGAILDLKEYIQTAHEGKLLLANMFSEQMEDRILHAGATTSELLSMYINVICAFKALDPRGVLLDKVAAPIRSYLRLRDDTVRIIAASFLADVDADGNVTNPSDEVCSDLAREIALSDGEHVKADGKGLDWDDMAWVPDPIDAGPDYQKSKSDDIMSFMLTLFERSDFIQEVQTLLGERLLTVEVAHSDLDKEIRLVEMFKTRFGTDGLQSCEVMLRDILESRRINTTLRPTGEAAFPTSQEIHAAIPEDGISLQGILRIFQSRIPRNHAANQQFIKLIKEVATNDKASGLLLAKSEAAVSAGDPNFSTLILSSFFWPELREDEFKVPEPISAIQKAYEADFERIKNMRKLHWLSALGRVTVELELEDRTIKVDGVQTWQASVIYTFQEDDNSPVKKTVQELEQALSMDELLVRNAIAYWISQRVLIETDKDRYQVLERLPTAEEESAAPTQAPLTAQADAAISAVKSQDAVLRDNREMYELFMIGMLTNGGAMDASRVTMMMKMVVPGGYNFGEEETKWLLAGLVEQGKAVESGSNYAIKK